MTLLFTSDADIFLNRLLVHFQNKIHNSRILRHRAPAPRSQADHTPVTNPSPEMQDGLFLYEICRITKQIMLCTNDWLVCFV